MEINSNKLAQKSGFTMTEVMVALFVSVMLSAGILKTYLFCQQTVQRRIEANVNLAQSRYFTEFFGKQINESQSSTLSLDSGGNQLLFTVLSESNTAWESAAFLYRPDTSDLVFTHNGGSRILLSDTFLLDEGSAFYISDGVVKCRLHVGKDEGRSIALNTAARPRNP
jgi:prepilin-type N-terminal cleavage/methylation domain-containing protein